ncbi:hypothetical protein K438DRAFT_645335 [Mycena galopus ATCC 62051]|nr:hypothetical protein K438DRAFT_645335 [Mycena galopus ATCC 62051]
MMFVGLALSALVAASVVWSHPTLKSRGIVIYTCQVPNTIALTFDDGPYIYHRGICDALTKAGAKATVMLNGNNWDCIYNPDRVADMRYAFQQECFMYTSHTWSHADLTTNGISDAQIHDAMYRIEEAFSRILGVLPAYMRPPYGNFNAQVESVAAQRNQALVLWDRDTRDADGDTVAQSEAVYDSIVNDGSPNALVLEHETEKSTAQELVPYAIEKFQAANYTLVDLATCLGLPYQYQAVGAQQQEDSSWTCDGTPDPGALCGGNSTIACQTGTVTVVPSSTPTPTSS